MCSTGMNSICFAEATIKIMTQPHSILNLAEYRSVLFKLIMVMLIEDFCPLEGDPSVVNSDLETCAKK